MMKLMAFAKWFVVLVFTVTAQAKTLVAPLSLSQSDRQNLAQLENLLEKNPETTEIVFDFKSGPTYWALSPVAEAKQYQKNYPRGDFYYLIGDLAKAHTQEDFKSFYNTAKWLAARGFRTVINVMALQGDLEEAVSNSRTSSIIWNSHGSEAGDILDAADTYLPYDIFTTNRSESLKFVLFANCYGQTSIKTYGLDKTDVKAFGWPGEVTSAAFFRYLGGEKFKADLKSAFKTLDVVRGMER